MFNPSSIVSLADLQTWFFALDKHGYLTLYRGNELKAAERLFSYNYTSTENGWQALSTQISLQSAGGGLFTIYVSSKKEDQQGYHTRFSAPIGIAGNPHQGHAANLAGTPDSIGALVEQEVSKRMTLFEKDKEIEELKSSIEQIKKEKGKKGITGILNDMGEVLEEYPTLANMMSPFVNAIAARFLGNYAPGTLPMSQVAGPTAPTSIQHEAGNDPDDQSYSEEELNRIVNCINDLATHFEDPIEVLEKITEFVNKNPNQAKLLLTNLQ